MSRILHKMEEKLHIHHKHEDDPAQKKPSEENHENDVSNANNKEDIHDDKKNLVKKEKDATRGQPSGRDSHVDEYQSRIIVDQLSFVKLTTDEPMLRS
ncbi:hypothetical protein RND71_014491 [Anisodus tanguticus]|uniref:Uncharacterized protein n=1 Tax=Anisodus tanguticus TaxID=243964 RepID=A0AAE1VJY7_9SOLA|nr:hypothetical protein RND71_014491 [Anisodus tanguticus]